MECEKVNKPYIYIKNVKKVTVINLTRISIALHYSIYLHIREYSGVNKV